MFSRTICSVIQSFVLLISLVLAAPWAPGQVVQIMAGDAADVGPAAMFSPTIARRDLERYEEHLGLDEEQRALAGALFDGYVESHQQAADAARRAMERMREQAANDDEGAMEDLGKVFEQFHRTAEKAEAQLLDDLRALLNAEQTERWPAFERMRRRDTQLRHGSLIGEGLDLIRLVGDLGMNPTPETVAALLERYEFEIDTAIQERERLQERRAKAMSEAAEEGRGAGPDPDRMQEFQELMEEMRRGGQQVQSVNRRYATKILAALEQPWADRFEQAFRGACHPQVFRKTGVQRTLDAVSRFDDLTPEQRTKLEEVQRVYERELEPLNRQWMEEREKAEEEGQAGLFGGVVAIAGGEGDHFVQLGGTEQEREVYQKRRELGQRIAEQINGILTESQRVRIPKQSEQTIEVFQMQSLEGDMVIQTQIVVDDGDDDEDE